MSLNRSLYHSQAKKNRLGSQHSLRKIASATIGAVACAFSLTAVNAQEPIRLGFMDPLSGTFASVGTSGLNVLEFAADYFYNSKGGILGGRMIEIVPLDNKQSPTETPLQFRRAVSEELRILFQGTSSAVANPLNTTIAKHNRRNAGQEVLQINYAAVDPNLTMEERSFWHFRFDAHAIMKLDVLTDFLAMNDERRS